MRIHLKEMQHLAGWHMQKNQLLNINKNREVILGKKETKTRIYIYIYIGRAKVQQVNALRFLGISFTKCLSVMLHISTLIKKNTKAFHKTTPHKTRHYRRQQHYRKHIKISQNTATFVFITEKVGSRNNTSCS